MANEVPIGNLTRATRRTRMLAPGGSSTVTLATYVILILLAAGIFLLLRSRRAPRNEPVVPPSRAPAADPIAEFWAWWETAKGPLAQAIHNRTVSEWTDPISERVHAIDPGLAWELGPGVK